MQHGLPEGSVVADGGELGQGLEVVADAFVVPALHRQGLEGSVIDQAAPAAALTDQQPIGQPLGIGEPEATQLAQAGAGIQHPVAAAGAIAHFEIPQNRLQGLGLGLVAGGAKAKPTKQDQPKAADAAAAQQHHGAQADGQQGEHETGGRGDLDTAALATSPLPNQRLQDQAAIEGQARQKVEQAQDEIQFAQLADQGA